MYENTYMYAIERSPEYLAHYGVRGMKWGVRKALKSGNARRLDRQYNKAARKLAKLEKRANSGKKYAKRAALLGAGAAAAGGLAAAGTEGVAKGMRALGSGFNKVGDAARAWGRTPGKGSKFKRIATSAGMKLNAAGRAMNPASQAVETWGKGKELTRGASHALNQFGSTVQARAVRSGSDLVKKGAAKVGTTSWKAGNAVTKANLSNNAIARIGAGVVGAGLAGAAGYNAYRAATTKRAAKKAAAFRSEMNKAFKGTKYASGGNGGNRQGKKRRNRG